MPVFENFFGSNLVENADFEGNTTNYWTAGNGAIKTIDSVNFMAGLYSMKIENGLAANSFVESNKVRVLPGDVIIYGGYVRQNNAATTINMQLQLYGFTGNVLVTVQSNFEFISPTWQYFSYKYVVPSDVGFASIRVAITNPYVGYSINIDEMFLINQRGALIDINRKIIPLTKNSYYQYYSFQITGTGWTKEILVPANEIWDVKSIGGFNETTAGARIEVGAKVGGNYYALNRKMNVAQNEYVKSGDFTVGAGDSVYAQFVSCLAGDWVDVVLCYQ